MRDYAIIPRYLVFFALVSLPLCGCLLGYLIGRVM